MRWSLCNIDPIDEDKCEADTGDNIFAQPQLVIDTTHKLVPTNWPIVLTTTFKAEQMQFICFWKSKVCES
jgi:hypothetical protein